MPGPRWDHLEIIECGLTPAQELVALAIAAVFDLDVLGERIRGAEHIGDHRVIDHQLGRSQRIDLGRITTHRRHRLTHRGEVDHTWHTREVLHDHSGGRELDLLTRLGFRIPAPSVRMSSAVMFAPSSARSRFSRRILRLYGRESEPSTASSRKIWYEFSPT